MAALQEYDVVHYGAQIDELVIDFMTLKISKAPDAQVWTEIRIRYGDKEIKSTRFRLKKLKFKNLELFVKALKSGEDDYEGGRYYQLENMDIIFEVLRQLIFRFKMNSSGEVLEIYLQANPHGKKPNIIVKDINLWGWGNFFKTLKIINKDFEDYFLSQS